MKKIISFFLILSISFTYAQISEIKENYFVVNNGILKKTYFDDKKFFFNPFYEWFIPYSKDFYPSYFYHGNYECIYKFKNKKLVQCETINYSKKKELINFKYDSLNNLISISSSNKTLIYTTKYQGSHIEIFEPSSKIKFVILSKNNLVYKLESDKAGYMYFYHDNINNIVEMLIPDDQYKIVYKYKNNRIFEIITYQAGEILNKKIINYENDFKGNWIKKTIKNNKGKTYVVTREIQYL